MLLKVFLLLLFLPSGAVAWIERKLFHRLSPSYFRRFAWLPLPMDGELPKLTPSRFVALASEHDGFASAVEGDELLMRTAPRSEYVPVVGDVELVPTLLFRLRFTSARDGTWHLTVRWGLGHQLLACALLLNTAVLGLVVLGPTEPFGWLLGGLIVVGVLGLGLATLRYRQTARTLMGELQMDVYRRAFE